MNRKLHRLIAMPARQRRLMAQAIVSIAATRLALAALPVRRVRRIFWSLIGARTVAESDKRCSLETVIHLVGVGAKYSPAGSTCLSVALVAQALLQRHGYESQFRIGVKRSAEGVFAAHAWLERDGRVIVGGPLALVQDYKPLPDVEGLLA